ncbi:hypothetical protein ACIBI3_34180 [Actinomadura luteofluorescens]|uniref:hypothetical protein n=1 Tax=Actinomadura luteofluorescens TaxID=46163 RepID=UPI0034758C8B
MPERSREWIVFSPPYPNNIDYTEVYKIEAWALELYGNSLEMKAQRLSTLRSHPSVLFPEKYNYQENPATRREIELLINPILAAVPEDRYQRGRKQVIVGYVDDMLSVLTNLRRVAAQNCSCAIVVGNSVHGSGESRYVIAADLVLSRLAELAGWAVEEIRVARNLRRRAADVDHLRESVIILRR